MRIRRSFDRPEEKKSARLIVIACEGETEQVYLNAVKYNVCARNVHMEILKRDSNESSPTAVYEQLHEFQEKYILEDDDQLWMLIDRDKWKDKNLAAIARLCAQNDLMHFVMSNPCFELWLILHFEDISEMTPDEITALKENRKSTRRSDTWTKKRIRRHMGSYSETSYDTNKLLPLLSVARDRAEALDVNKSERWPADIGTRVYRVIDSILNK